MSSAGVCERWRRRSRGVLDSTTAPMLGLSQGVGVLPAGDSFVRKVEWTIKNFKSEEKLSPKGTPMWSPRFKLAGISEVRLEFLPNGREKSWSGFCSLFLWCPPGTRIRYQLWVGSFMKAPDEDTYDAEVGHGHSNFCPLAPEIDLANDSVTVGCNIFEVMTTYEMTERNLKLSAWPLQQWVKKEAEVLENRGVKSISWKVHKVGNALHLYQRGASICSPCFTAAGISDIQMEFYPNGCAATKKDRHRSRVKCPEKVVLIVTLIVGKVKKGPIRTTFDRGSGKGLPDFCSLKEQINDDDTVDVGIELQSRPAATVLTLEIALPPTRPALLFSGSMWRSLAEKGEKPRSALTKEALPSSPPEEALARSDGSRLQLLEDQTLLRWTQRSNGSWRKPEIWPVDKDQLEWLTWEISQQQAELAEKRAAKEEEARRRRAEKLASAPAALAAAKDGARDERGSSWPDLENQLQCGRAAKAGAGADVDVSERLKELICLREPPSDALEQADGTFQMTLDDGATITWTRRPDGTWRRPEHRRAGWDDYNRDLPLRSKPVLTPNGYTAQAQAPQAPKPRAEAAPKKSGTNKVPQAKAKDEAKAAKAAKGGAGRGSKDQRRSEIDRLRRELRRRRSEELALMMKLPGWSEKIALLKREVQTFDVQVKELRAQLAGAEGNAQASAETKEPYEQSESEDPEDHDLRSRIQALKSRIESLKAADEEATEAKEATPERFLQSTGSESESISYCRPKSTCSELMEKERTVKRTERSCRNLYAVGSCASCGGCEVSVRRYCRQRFLALAGSRSALAVKRRPASGGVRRLSLQGVPEESRLTRRSCHPAAQPPTPEHAFWRVRQRSMASKYRQRLAQSSGVSSSRAFESDIGKKILMKYGWREGQGLGRLKNGRTECVQGERREEKKGLGVEKRKSEDGNSGTTGGPIASTVWPRASPSRPRAVLRAAIATVRRLRRARREAASRL
eukprot:g23889.t2